MRQECLREFSPHCDHSIKMEHRRCHDCPEAAADLRDAERYRKKRATDMGKMMQTLIYQESDKETQRIMRDGFNASYDLTVDNAPVIRVL
jgi:hypothetical protein